MQIKLGFIGCGNMATAIMGGAVSSEFIAGENIFVFDVDGEKANALNEKYGVNICDSAESVAENTDVTVLAVKPQVFSTVLPQIKDAVAEKGTAIDKYGFTKSAYPQMFDKWDKIMNRALEYQYKHCKVDSI